MSGWTAGRGSGSVAITGLAVLVGATAAATVLGLRNDTVVAEDQVLLGAYFCLPLVGLLLVWRRPANAVGWLLAVSGVVAAVYLFAHEWTIFGLRTELGSVPLATAAAWLSTWLQVPAIAALPFVAATFPTGRIQSGWLRRLGWAAVVAIGALAAAQAVAPDDLDGVPERVRPIPNPLGIERIDGISAAISTLAVLVVAAFTVAAVVDAIIRFRRATGDERQQLRWVAAAAAVIPATLTAGIFMPVALGDVVIAGGQVLGLVGVAVAIGIAILKYRLYDLGEFLRRTAIRVALSVGVVAGVVGVAVGVGVLIPGDDELPATIAAVVAALALGPLRARLQRGVDRLLFGRRSEPFDVLTSLGERLGSAADAETTLRTVVDATATALRLPYVAIELVAGRETSRSASSRRVEHGAAPSRVTALPLVHRNEVFGHLIVGHRSTDEDLSPDEGQLLADIARQAATVVHAVTLTDALLHARQELVGGREEERRRLRRELHDGIGPTLAGSMLQLDSLTELIGTDPADAAELVVKLKRQLRQVVDDVRRVAHDLRPPVLDELGLLAALRGQADSITAAADVEVTLSLPERVGPLAAAIEVAVYRIASEALTNVVRHAHAAHCTLTVVMIDGCLELSIVDDGVGVPADSVVVGVGLVSMRERAEELGGTLTIEQRQPSGTLVRASFPFTEQP